MRGKQSTLKEAIQSCLQCLDAKAIVNFQGRRPKGKDVWWRVLVNSLQVHNRGKKGNLAMLSA